MDLQSDTQQETLIVGRVLGHYGVQGWVKVFSYTKPIESILTYSQCFISESHHHERTEIIDGVKKGKLIILKLANIENRELAQKFIDSDILLPSNCLPELEYGHYYWHDLEGLSVINDQSEILGTVSKLMETGANDVMVVEGNKQIQIPIVMNKVIKKVDLKSGHIVVDWEWVD